MVMDRVDTEVVIQRRPTALNGVEAQVNVLVWGGSVTELLRAHFSIVEVRRLGCQTLVIFLRARQLPSERGLERSATSGGRGTARALPKCGSVQRVLADLDK